MNEKNKSLMKRKRDFNLKQTKVLAMAAYAAALSFALSAYGYILPASPCAEAVRRMPAPLMSGLKITGVNVDVTEALREHAEAKMSVPLDKFSSVLNDAIEPELHFTVEGGSNDEKHLGQIAHKAEITAHLKGKQRSITVHTESEDLYASVDELEALLARQLRKAKEQWVDKQVARGVKGKETMEAEILEDEQDGTE
jgi:ribosomal subunit interface protein